MSTVGTSLATFGSSLWVKTVGATSARYTLCSSESLSLRPVFDILNSGPRNRFTILTDRGPLIVHNCGYAGGVGAFATFAAAYGLDLDALAANVLPTAPADLVDEARSFLAWMRKQPKANTFGMPDDTFVGCDVVKRGWRNGHPAIAAWWPVLEQAFRDAIDSPGYTFDCGTVKVRRDGNWLRILLPSGRYLCYPAPEIDEQGRCSYMGVDQYTRKWQRIHTYSGKLAENCIAGGTLVVTDHGAVPIEQVSTAMRVWDGVEFVSHAGVVPKGEQRVIESFGVWMTPEHMVLTTEGWARGDTASRERRTRAACGLPAGAGRAPVAAGRSAQRSAQVFDILDCGPLTRFVCLDNDGQPVIVHNCTQAFARDVLAHNMPRIEAEGYRIVLSVHDELLTETPDSDEFSSDTLAAHMSTVPPWAEGLPLAAAGFETYRYKKD